MLTVSFLIDLYSALEVMKDLIGVHHELIEPTFYALKRFELSFYRNQIIHLFVSEGKLLARSDLGMDDPTN